MSTLPAGLALHLPLDEAQGARDVSGRGADGTVQGILRRVWDGDFGSAAEFADGAAHVAAPDPLAGAGAWTLALWVRRAVGAPSGTKEGIVGVDADGVGGAAGPALWWYDGALRYVTAAGTDGVVDGFFPPAGGWVHLAWVSDATGQRFFRNGAQVAAVPVAAPTAKDGLELRIGRLGDAGWAGRIAHVRAWRRALAESELWDALAADRVVPFRASHPLEFELRGPDDEHAIYIGDNPAAPTLAMTLSVRNTSGRPIVFRPLPVGGATVDAHHLRLRFRRGVLSRASLAELALAGGGAGWQGAHPVVEADSVSFFLRRAGTDAWTLGAGEAVELTLAPLSADPAGGTRGTRVELLTHALGYDAGEGGAIEETRTQALSIVNHTGRRHAPLRVGIVGSSTVLNNGVAEDGNRLRLRITSTLAPDPDAPGRSSLPMAGTDAQAPTRFIITVPQEPNDAPGTMPWALGRAGELESIRVTQPDGWRCDIDQLSDLRRWTLTPVANTALGPGESLEVVMEKIATSLPAGSANLTVRWEDLPGYWDDQQTVSIDKSPLVLRPGSVGVGTADPRGFHVLLPENGGTGPLPGVLLSGGGKGQGNAKIELRNAAGGTPYIDFSANGADYDARLLLAAPGKLAVLGASLGVGVNDPVTTLDVNGNIGQRGTDFLLGYGNNQRGNTGHSRALVKDDGGRLTVNYGSDFSGGVNVRGPRIMLDGKVGVGADSGAAQLTVRATSNHLQLRREGADEPRGKVLFLELYQDQAGTAEVHPIIRFHHNNRFWHRIEGRSDGLHILTGDTNSDATSNLFAGVGVFNALQIGGTKIGERELHILQRLAAGSLEFDLYNVKQDEYLYAADYAPYDNDRRRVFTWRPKGRINQGRWRLTYPG